VHLAIHVEEEAEEGEKVKEKNHSFKMSFFERLFVNDNFRAIWDLKRCS